VIYGGGSQHGFFMSHRGHFKGPCEQLKRALAKRTVVAVASEYRTSRLCAHCGWRLHHLHRGQVSFCKNHHCHSHFNRDLDGATKIGYRYMLSCATLFGFLFYSLAFFLFFCCRCIASWLNLPLGPFAQSEDGTEEYWTPHKPERWPAGPSMRDLYTYRRLTREQQGSRDSRRIVIDPNL
jgi:hypothetical protein